MDYQYSIGILRHFRAVIWTDTLQFGSMIVALCVVMTIGTLQMGGIINIFELADAGGRLIWFK